jgi:hypothetical protein
MEFIESQLLIFGSNLVSSPYIGVLGVSWFAELVLQPGDSRQLWKQIPKPQGDQSFDRDIY